MSPDSKRTLMGMRPPTPEEQAEAKRQIEAAEQSAQAPSPESQVTQLASNIAAQTLNVESNPGREPMLPPETADGEVIDIRQNEGGVFVLKHGPKRIEHTPKGTFKMPTVPRVVVDDSQALPKTHAQMVPPAPMTVTEKGTVRLGTIPKSAWAKDAEEKSALEKKTTVQIAAAAGLLPSTMMAPYRPEEAHVSMRKSPTDIQQFTGNRALAIVASVATFVSVVGSTAIYLSGKNKEVSNATTAVATATPPIPEQTKPEPTSIPTAAPIAEPTSEPAAIDSSSPNADAGVPTRASKSSAPLAPKRTVPSSKAQPIPVPAEPKKSGNNSVIDPWAK